MRIISPAVATKKANVTMLPTEKNALSQGTSIPACFVLHLICHLVLLSSICGSAGFSDVLSIFIESM